MWQFERLIAHRGASAYAPENTIAAFEKARSLGCRLVEFDVMLSQDGEAFVFHDDTLNRTTNSKGKFGLTSADVLHGLDAGRWFSRQFRQEKIPTLRDALAWLVANEMQANIEIKPYPGCSAATTTAVLTHLNQFWPHNKPLPLLSSFDLDALSLCRSLAPEVQLGLLLDKWQDDWLHYARDLQCFSLHFNRRALSKVRVHEIKQHGYQLAVYTVNRRRQARKLFDWGVDAIFSDYPDLLS